MTPPLTRMRMVFCALAASIVIQPCLAGDPKPVENDFVKITAAGLIIDTKHPKGPVLKQAFGFELKKPLKVKRVQIEDVTDKPAVPLVDDKDPGIEKDHWSGSSPNLALNPQNYPWMFDGRTTKRLFRFTISSAETPAMVLKQPARFHRSSKELMLRAASRVADKKER